MTDKSFLTTEDGLTLHPISDNIIFKFCANLTKSTFQPVTAGGIIISDKDDYDEHTFPQWGEILALGPDVCDDIRNAKYVLIEPHRWTHKVRLNGPFGEYLWKTETQYILAVSDVYINPYTY